jgi:ATP-dependent Clp protease protease subunit
MLSRVEMLKQLERALALHARYAANLGTRELRGELKGDRGSLYIYDIIGLDWWTGTGITGKSVAEELAGLKAKGAKAVDVYVNSPGGDIFEAKAIFAELRRFDGERKVHVDGIAASAASFIAMAGDHITTAPAATWMIHEVWARVAGTAADHRKLADVLDIENQAFAQTYAARSKQKVEDVMAWMSAETWMNADTAKARGFTDSIAEPSTGPSGQAALVATLNTAVSTLRV